MVHQHGDHHDIPHEHKVHRAGGWLPTDHRINEAWVGQIVDHAKQNPKQLSPALEEFKNFIDNNSRIRMLFQSMFEEVCIVRSRK